jgi:putative spermidine/putrescine transport system ATP-binding protein
VSFVEFDDVCKTYDGLANVIDHLHLAIVEGEFLSLLGPSGSGKTTTLMMLAGFERPTAGHIRLRGQPIDRLPPYRRNFGMVFQNYALFPHMTVGENLAFPLSVRGVDRHHAGLRIKRALEMVRMPGFEARFPGQLSGGQQQRIAVARALVFEPQLVLMDEPLGALDKQLREEMQFELRSLHEALGITTIYVTHDQSEAMTMSDRVAVFHHGRIQQIDDPQALYERPANVFVASFIGESNRLQARLVAMEDEDLVLLEIAGGARLRGRLVGNGSAVAAWTTGRATLSVRPERVTVLETAASAGDNDNDSDNRLPAHVEERIFLGTHLRVRLRTAAGDLIASVPAPSASGVPKEGSDAVVRWAAASTVVFPA